MTIGQRIKKIRIDKGLTLGECAKRAFGPQALPSRWADVEADRNDMLIGTLLSIVNALGVSTADLLTTDEGGDA